jgi:HD-GYP domain-containing protein (c-di-GMP phosphodiesterase class II)
MTSTPQVRPALAGLEKRLPLVVHFDGDETARGMLTGIQRFRRLSHNDYDLSKENLEQIYLVTDEFQVQQNLRELRRPNVRVLALSDSRFRDPRCDGAVYAYVPMGTPQPLLERMLENALDHIQLLSSRRELSDRLHGASREIEELNKIGAALSAEHDTGKLLEMILTKSREITQSDAGSLYLVEEAEPVRVEMQTVEGQPTTKHPGDQTSKLVKMSDSPKRLRFKLAQNDSVDIPFREATMEISENSIAGHVAMTGKIVAIADAYHLPPDVPYSINRKFDEDSGYRTKSILAVPMKNQKGEIVGVLQLINAKRDFQAKLTNVASVTQQVVPYGERQQEIVRSLASQAAVALENSQLYEAIQKLFEGFVRASVIAIEARDPTTSGHSFRVANLTVALAEAVDRADSGPFANVKFTRNEMKEIRYASLLHDFGKVGVREEVLVKARKLYPAQRELVLERFQFVKRSMQLKDAQERLDFILKKSKKAYQERKAEFDKELEVNLQELSGFLEIVMKSDEPSVMPEGNFEKLLDIAARRYLNAEGEEKQLLTEDEVRLLSIRKGSLDDRERRQIESHVVHTFNFLQQIPWTKEIKSIPAIARGHHEKLNGEGYPYKLSAPEIPVQTRMMTISDIFDALSASDRPYKKAVSLERALEILGFAVKDGEIDPALFELFKEARVFDKWKVEPYRY